jgi:hypothetical protein
LRRGRIGDTGEQRAAELALRNQVSSLVGTIASRSQTLFVFVLGPPLLVQVTRRVSST